MIVVDKGALETPKFAARELQTYVEKASGAKLPIVEKPVAGKKVIFVGESEFTKVLGLSLDEVKPEGFMIRTVGDALVNGARHRGRPARYALEEVAANGYPFWGL